MTTYTFPAESFTVEGDPVAVRETARSYGRFATVAGDAAADLRSLDSSAWVGTEGDEFRAQTAELPPPLEVAHESFAQVSRALDGFADSLADAQRRMRSVRADAEASFTSLTQARASQSALREPSEEAKQADPAAQARFETAKSDVSARVNGAQSSFDDQLRQAGSVRAQVREASARQAAAIRAAGRRSPTHGQNWLSDHAEKAGRWIDDNLGGLRNWIGEHANVLRGISSAMRRVGQVLVGAGLALAALSAAAGVFSFGIGWLGELPAGAMIAAGGLLWGGGDALETTVDWGEGKIDGQQLLMKGGRDLALTVASMGVGKVAERAIAAGLERLPESVKEKIARWIRQFLDGKKSKKDTPDFSGIPGEKGTREWAEAVHERFPELTPEDALAIHYYTTDDGYKEINDYLRGTAPVADPDHARAAVAAATHALNKLPPHVGTTYRGTQVPNTVFERWKREGVVDDAAFQSSDVRQGTALAFAKQKPPSAGSTRVLLEIEGHTGRDVAALSDYSTSEAEVLFSPGSSFHVLSIEPRPDNVIVMRVREP